MTLIINIDINNDIYMYRDTSIQAENDFCSIEEFELPVLQRPLPRADARVPEFHVGADSVAAPLRHQPTAWTRGNDSDGGSRLDARTRTVTASAGSKSKINALRLRLD